MLQVLQYEEIAGTWSEIGKTERARKYHGVVELKIDASPLCSGIVGQISAHCYYLDRFSASLQKQVGRGN